MVAPDLECLRQGARSPASELGAEDVCANCERSLAVNGLESICREGTELFCCANCRWATLLDINGARHKAAKRAKSKGKPKRRRRKRQIIDDDAGKDKETDCGSADDHFFGGSGGNAMFGYHVSLSGLSILEFDCSRAFR